MNKDTDEHSQSYKDSVKRFLNKKKSISDINQLFSKIIEGNISALSKGITLLESTNPSHRKQANELLQKCMPYAGNAYKIGITGVPGVGKSTFIEAFGQLLIEKNQKLAVLAIDPSSKRSGGSILGDKTRMETLSASKNAFIRPTAAGKTLGGVAQHTREAQILCEAAGFNYIFIETVGVGQSETAVRSMVDFFLLLMLAGAGDELQGIKRGIMEMADALFITKSDFDLKKAKSAAQSYKIALHLFPPNESNWYPKVGVCSAIEKTGLHDILEVIEQYKDTTIQNGWWEKQRSEQQKFWFHDMIQSVLTNHFYRDNIVKKQLKTIEIEVEQGKRNPFEAANILLKEYFTKK